MSENAPPMPEDMPDDLLDARGLTCPLPVLRAAKKLKTLAPGALLEIRASDPASARDFAAFCEQTGNTLVRSEETGDGLLRYLIRKTG